MAQTAGRPTSSVLGDLRAWSVVSRLLPYVQPSERVLDVGAGSCRVGSLLASRSGARVSLVDRVDHNETALPLQLYDGRTLPYLDNAFDVSMLGFVLHHASDPDAVVDEVQRVTRGRVLVLEDTPRTALEQRIWAKGDYFFNHRKHADIDVAHVQRSGEEWISYFRSHGFGILHRVEFRSPFLTGGTYPHTLLVLACPR
jgi:ubiquinone/menaquinone biosynthesis C-methylase UbiE